MSQTQLVASIASARMTARKRQLSELLRVSLILGGHVGTSHLRFLR